MSGKDMSDQDPLPSSPNRRGARAPGFLHLGVTLAIVLVAALGARARQPPPPSIAEFAPQAIEQIRDAPDDQISDVGAGEGIGGGTARSPAPRVEDPEPEPIDVPRVRRCVGSPPRQIEDPQSPPCVPYWDGDNGGATWRGVTRDEVRIMVPTAEGNRVVLYQALERFFNKRFEFYGRKLRFVYGRADSGSNDWATQQAEASDYAARHRPFATTMYKSATGVAYSAEMARRGIVTVTQSFLSSDRPTLWQYTMAPDRMFASLGDWVCRRLAGRPPAHAGEGITGGERIFGIVFESGFEGDDTRPDALERRLAGCGAPVGERSVDEFETTVDAVSASGVMLRMKEAGVTSVICLCHLFDFGGFQQAATAQRYFPEWLVSSYGFADRDSFIKTGGNPPEQMEHTFGVSFVPRQVPLVDEPFWWAAREVDRSFSWSDTSGVVGGGTLIYRPLLLLASGIQMAGPNLTPETFERGLERALFPNPPHPNMAGAVGFADGSHSMTDDGAEIWWSHTAQGPFSGDGPGTYCSLNGHRRYRNGAWPTGKGRFFTAPCDVARRT